MQSSSVRRVPPSTSLRQLLAIALTPLGAALLPLPAHAQFMPTGAGPFDYNTTGNWTSGTINGVFSQTPSVAQAVTFSANSTLATGLTFSLGGTSPSLTLRGDGTARTVTLGGDVSVSGTTSAIVLGSTTAGNGLNFLLGADRTFFRGLGQYGDGEQRRQRRECADENRHGPAHARGREYLHRHDHGQRRHALPQCQWRTRVGQ
jgi:hypothetical protein